MPQQDTTQIKQKILSILRFKGPCLPVHVAKEINMSILFASAFLSELLSDKEIKISNLKVGGSPVYFISGQEPKLEKYSDHLNKKEKEAFQLLHEKKFLPDKTQEPAIRVALRSIKDFAIPFEKQGELYWRYFTAKESEFILPKEKKIEKKIEVIKPVTKQQDLDIFDKKLEKKEKPKVKVKKIIKRKTQQKAGDKFFNKVKETLNSKGIVIEDIESFSKNDLILKVNDKEQEKILFAFKKKKISEADILKAYKHALELKLPYMILSLGEPSKKLKGFIAAIKGLSSIEKI